ncbi:MAG TPA: glycoside hydrolase family 9 protein [Chitinophaga sp.]|uniref:glycoside hydrolase family 9 protein n=1 Tax=Chitinophaga sp. TaxID=1869181 RepID=UPI002C190E0C|nr:glycoside hydrolase family 9 protein [Chitinophaga sp.]HVI44621.1 glycoside hydrolase family 9 protein [Chitinophaga sp.]
MNSRMLYYATLLLVILALPGWLKAQSVLVVVNQAGYEASRSKKAIVAAGEGFKPLSFSLINATTGAAVLTGTPVSRGAVKGWKGRLFWSVDFSGYSAAGAYRVAVRTADTIITSTVFKIGKNILEQQTVSDVIYYFKGQRSTGLLDKADHALQLSGKPGTRIDAHGGWYDATGDYGKHLSHLSFSSYFNPQQISLTVYSLINTYDLLRRRPGNDFRQFNRRLLDEAMYGADYLARTHAKDGSFYRSVSSPGAAKKAADRVIRAEDDAYAIKKTKDQVFSRDKKGDDWRSYQCSFRSGGGLAIAALAKASTYDTSGEYSHADYLRAAEEAYAFLAAHNAEMTNDGQENIVDDYCALTAATELYKATHKAVYKAAADKRAAQLTERLHSWKQYEHYWRADNNDRPFFHPSDAGLPVVSLLLYYPVADPAMRQKIREAMKLSLQFELAVTHEVNNPFGYSRQLVQDTTGARHTAFFFPHHSEAAPWWQGENARLGSMAAAARMAASLYESPFRDSLEVFATDQLNWILGLNPFDACMLQGTGHNNPAYGFFGTFEYTNAPGGIVNGITSGLDDEDDIAFNISYAVTGKDYDWRWAEQWLPHTAWYLWAVAVE